MYRNPLLLCLSKNPTLLEIRRAVLSRRYDVVAISSVGQLGALSPGSAFSLLVLCHTFTEAERQQIRGLAYERWPQIKILGIRNQASWDLEDSFDLSIGSLDGPPAMFAGISKLLGGQPG